MSRSRADALSVKPPSQWSARLLRPRHLALGLVPEPATSKHAKREALPDLDSICDLCIDGLPHPHLS